MALLPPTPPSPSSSSSSSSTSNRSRSLMESLLLKKMESVAQNTGTVGPGGSLLIRSDSVDSASSITSSIIGDDVCECDDCLLGIADLYTLGPIESAQAKKKVN